MNNNSRFFFAFLSAAAAVGIGNIWLYPYFSFKLTGLFFIPYLIALILLGIPLLLLEFSIGQYFNKNVVDLFASIRKWFSSIGWLMVFNAFIVMGYYAVILSWHMIYFFVSFGMQWKENAEDYFFDNVLQVSSGFNNFTQFSLPVFIALIITWIIIFLYIRKGQESMKKTVLFTFLAFAILMFFFFIYTLSLDNALNGIYSMLKPNFKEFFKLNVWTSSFSLAIVSLGLSFGIMPAFARKANKGFVVSNSIIVVVAELLISIAIGFILFGILGFLSMKQGIDLEKVAFSDPSTSFTVLAQALPFFYKPSMLSLLFFIFLSLFFILGTSALAYSISHVLVHKFNTKHRSAAVTVSGLGFLIGLLFIIKPGFYVLDIVAHFVYYNILITILLQALAVGWFFDSEKISDFINQNSLLKIGNFWRILIKYFIPLVLIILLFLQIKSDYLLNYNNYPLYAILIFGIGIVIVPITAAFLMPQKLLDRK